MSRYTNKDTPYFDNVTGEPLPFGKVYFGQPNTDPLDQLSNAKAPFEDLALTIDADSVQILDIAGKLPDRLYLSGAYAITVTDADDNVIDTDPYYVGESTDQIVNDSDVTGATVTDALNELLARIVDIEANIVDYNDVWPVGGIYFTTVNENPGSRLSFGTWVADGEGRCVVGVGQGTDANGYSQTYAVGDTFGVYRHTLTEAESPTHSHAMFYAGTQAAGNPEVTSRTHVVAREFDQSGNNDQYIMKRVNLTGQLPTVGTTSDTGDGDPHINTQPSIAFYIWRRTA